MRILLINSVCGVGSTGRICTDLAQQFEAEGHEVKIAYGRGKTVAAPFEKYAVRIGNDVDFYLHALQTRLFDQHGLGSKQATKKFLEWAEEFNPDLLWLHNIHGYYINIEMLFAWIKSRPDMQVKWTLHDCWAFTGHCAYFTMAQCEKWKDQCKYCSQSRRYPGSYRDNCTSNFDIKKKAFTGVRHMELITPSKWLAGLVNESFLAEYPVDVQHNKIDTSTFKPTPSHFRKQHGLERKKIILGVAAVWDTRKGFADFLELAKILDDSFALVMVGLTEKQIHDLPERIVGIKRTNSPQELAAIYTAADVLFNPTYEDNYPTVNLEAQACGTKVVTYDTGGSAETLYRDDSVAVKTGDLLSAIKEMI